MAEAGFAALDWNQRIDDRALMEALAQEVRRLGHYPVKAELQMRRREDSDFPSEATFSRRGSKAELITLVLAYCETDEAAWADVLSILRPLAKVDATRGKPAKGRTDELIAGYVYLIKSGGHYKIGFSTDVQRRMTQLNTGMPEAGELVHTISTDDPPGIERYWHQRFGNRRLRSDAEWFALTNEDVRAFKRRKFQ